MARSTVRLKSTNIAADDHGHRPVDSPRRVSAAAPTPGAPAPTVRLSARPPADDARSPVSSPTRETYRHTIRGHEHEHNRVEAHPVIDPRTATARVRPAHRQ
jgi:hypothetical protein